MKVTSLEIQTEGLPNQSQNCRILFEVRQSIFLNVVFSALRSIGRQTRLPKDKGYSLLWSPNIYSTVCGSTSRYWHLSSQRGGITQPTMKAIVTNLYDAEIRLQPRLLNVVHQVPKRFYVHWNLFYSCYFLRSLPLRFTA